MKFASVHNYLSLALKLILIISIINSIFFQLWHLVSTSIFLLILLLIPSAIKKSYRIIIPTEFEILLLLFVIASLIFGKIGGVVTPLFFGIAVNLIGFVIMFMLYSADQIKKNHFLIILFSFNFAIALGFGIEFLKYYLKILLGHEMTVDYYYFSMKNMTYVISGAVIASMFGFAYMKNKKGVIKNILKRFEKMNPEIFSKIDSPEKIIEMINKEESEVIEFKSTLRVNLCTNEIDKKIEHATLKTISSFLNSKGGTLLIGISDDKKITGIEKDRFENNDKFNLHLTNLIKEKIGKRHIHLINHQLFSVEEKTIVKIDCQKSDRPIFLKTPSGEEEFYVRAGPSSNKIAGSELVDYIKKRFEKNN